MRTLTAEEQSLLKRRQAGFDQFLHERMPVLTDFFERLGYQDAAMVLVEPARFLEPLDGFLQKQNVDDDPDTRVWIQVRLGYFLGELLIARHGGHWFLNVVPDTRYFLHYVVGQFQHPINANAVVDPMVAANIFLAESSPRSLVKFVEELESELQQA